MIVRLENPNKLNGSITGQTSVQSSGNANGDQTQVTSKIRVIVADDHRVVCEGTRELLQKAGDVEVVGEASNGEDAVRLAVELNPDVAIMDVAMPVMAGDEASEQIKQRLPQTRIVALSMFDDARVADHMRRAGAAAYLLKTAPTEELLAAIRGN